MQKFSKPLIALAIISILGINLLALFAPLSLKATETKVNWKEGSSGETPDVGFVSDEFPTVIKKITAWMLYILIIVAVIIIIIGGYNIVFSQGSDESVEKGKKMIMYAIVGVIVAFLAKTVIYWIVDIIGGK